MKLFGEKLFGGTLFVPALMGALLLGTIEPPPRMAGGLVGPAIIADYNGYDALPIQIKRDDEEILMILIAIYYAS